MKPKLHGQYMRTVPATVQLLIPLHHVDDLPQIARRLRELADELIAVHNSDHYRPEQKFTNAYIAVNTVNRIIKRECQP